MAAPASLTLVPIRGLLGGDGSRPLHVSICTGGAPAQPPPRLAGLVRAVSDKDGRVVDWLLDQENAGAGPIDALSEYREWYATFAVHRYIGECAFANSLLKWARPHCNVSALDFLRAPQAYVDFKTALSVRSQAGRVGRLLQTSNDVALGVFTPPEHRSPIRALMPSLPHEALLSTATCKLIAEPDGLLLRRSGFADPIRVRSWELSDDAVAVETPEGSVILDDPRAAQLLSALGKRAPRAAVRPQPLRVLAAMLLVSLHEATTLATSAHVGFAAFAGPALPYLATRG